jgi:hypothetical protein
MHFSRAIQFILAIFFIPISIFGYAVSEEVSRSVIDQVWSGHPVGFSLLTSPPYQYAAYYNAERQMILAQRKLDSETWVKHPIDQHIGWDSHNYITLALDDEQNR